MAMKFVGTLFDLVIPWILAYLIDEAAPDKNIPLIIILGGVMLATSAGALTFNILANRTAARVAMNVTNKLRYDLFKKTMKLSCRQINRFSVPSVIMRLTSNTYDVNQMLGMIQRIGLRAPILLIGGIAVTLSLDAVLTLALIATIPVIIGIVYFVTKRGVPLYTQSYKAADKTTRIVRENVTGVRVIKALSKTDYEKRRYDKANYEQVQLERKASMTMAVSNPAISFVLNLGLIAVILLGAYRVDSGLTEPGKIIAFMSYFLIIVNALIAITRVFVVLSRASASSKRIFEIINTEDEPKIESAPGIETDFHIVFDGVTFSYEGKTDNISGLDFHVRKGETFGIIGGTGSGKSTVINLLMRFYDPGAGAIYIDGEDIRTIEFERLYKKFGVALQGDIIFADTISNNIDFYRGIPSGELADAAHCAQAAPFIESGTGGYGRHLAIKGADLSGGQKQRLLISRALAGNADIIILDDSSSALDFKTDADLRRALRNNYGDCTKIITGQRISTVMHADRILVLDGGRAVGIGTHSELVKNCPEYREIYELQIGGGQ